MAGVVCGTPEYMSPEQARGDDLDGRTDVYSLGVLIYQTLTNTLPFQAETALGVVTKHLSQKPDPPSNLAPGIHPGLEALVLRLLHKKAEERPQSALEVAEELKGISDALALAASGRSPVTPGPVGLAPAVGMTGAPVVVAGRGLTPLGQAGQAGQAEQVRQPGSGGQAAEAAQAARVEQVERGEQGEPEQAIHRIPTPQTHPAVSFGHATGPMASGARGGRAWAQVDLWLLTLTVAALVAFLGWFFYRATYLDRYLQEPTPPAADTRPMAPEVTPDAG